MEQDINKIETTGAGVEKVHTKLKFIKSEKNGAFISFVSQNPVNGVVCGVRQDSPYPKRLSSSTGKCQTTYCLMCCMTAPSFR